MTTVNFRTGGEPLSAGPEDDQRYGAMAIFLHWTIALLILLEIGLGWYMNEILPDHSAARNAAVALHESIGLTALLLILARIGVRLTHRAPPLGAGLHPVERMLARATHVLFYLLMLALPLTGWTLVSIRHKPIPFWGATWPQLPGTSLVVGSQQRPLSDGLQQVHTSILIWIVLATLVLHVAGALWHQFGDHPVLWKMLPFIKPKPRPARGS